MPPVLPVGFDFKGHRPLIGVAFVLPFIGGIALDARLHSGPFFTTTGSIVGFLAAVGVVLFYRKDFRE